MMRITDAACVSRRIASTAKWLLSLSLTLSAAGCNIEVVLIDTEGHKAIDVFYVTRDHRPLDTGLHNQLRRDLLSACGPARPSSSPN